MKAAHTLPDQNQNFWQLTSIQGASQSITGILTGGIIAREYGDGVALFSICVGNLLLWLVGLGTISIAAKGRKNAIESVQGFLGKSGSFFMSLIMLVAFLSWYMLEIEATTKAMTPLFLEEHPWKFTTLGAVFGLTTACISIGGIRLIKWVCVIGFPFLLFFIVLMTILSGHITFTGFWNVSFPPIITIFSLVLPGMVNLPTFFRHSHSRADSFLALTLITVFTACFQIFSVCTKLTHPAGLFTQLNYFGANIHIFLSLLFVLISLVCLNLVNIYYSSVALEIMIPKLQGRKGYFLIGITGTALFLFLKTSPPMLFLNQLTNNFISNFGIALLLSFLVHVIVKHKTTNLEKSVNFMCWSVGCIIALIMQIMQPQNPIRALLGGFCGIMFVFLLVFFVEQTISAFRKLHFHYQQQRKHQ